jgi:PEP-CTERM motif
MKLILKAAVAACAMCVASSASAAVYDWAITSALYNGSGQLTTEDTANPNALLVTVFSGTLNGWEVTLRDPGTYDNNNLLFPDGASFPDTGPTTSLVGHQGIAFLADGLSWRLFADPIAPHPMTLASICCFSRVDFSIEPATTAAVPEPGTWTMMLLGFGAAGFALRRRKQTELTFRRAA